MSPIDIISARAASSAELSASDEAEAEAEVEEDDAVALDDEAVELVSVVDEAESVADEPAASSVIVEAVSQAANKNVAANNANKGLNILCSQKDEQTETA